MQTAEETVTTIGLEVHCQLTNLATKLFCRCSSDYRQKEPNTNICPICMGLPGTLPYLNEKAIHDAVMVALAVNAEISTTMLFFRKNYFYPDMPKNFQITQYDKAGGVPFARSGLVQLDESTTIKLSRMNLEEDPAKLTYEGTIDTASATLVDYNRAGIALLEIVTEPDIKSPRMARVFLQKLRSILEHLGVSNGDLEGAMRCDANISLASGRVEIKNISSFKEVERALNFEISRQKSMINKGINVQRETRHWDELRRVTISMRTKEEEKDYRYFPEADLVPIEIPPSLIENIRASMPELPSARKKRFMEQYGLPAQNAEVLTANKVLADYFEEAAKLYPNAEKLSNWLLVDFLGYLHELDLEVQESRATPQNLARMLQLIDDGTISGKIAKGLLEDMVKSGGSPDEIIKASGLRRIADVELLERLVNEVFQSNPQAVRDALVDPKAAHFLVGQLMKATGGKADPELANRLISKKLSDVASASSSS